MPLSSYPMPQTSVPRSTPCLQSNRNNWMNSWMKILRADAYNHRNHPWPPLSFHQKEGWKPPLSLGLPKAQCDDCEECLPPPLIPDILNKVSKAKAQYFTKLDVCWGYNNLWIKEGDEWKADFWTNRGFFEPLVMFFGLTNSLATFQMMMNDIFKDMDDILIFGSWMKEQHHTIVVKVLDILQKHSFYLKVEKCIFEQPRVEYLGLIISEGHIEMDLVKVAGIQDLLTPKNVTEVQSFVGFVNFY